jgi:hypothetical protein
MKAKDIRELEVKMAEMEAYLKRLEMLIKHFGFCHPDIQVARLDKHEAFKKWREHWGTECDPRMPVFQPRD